MVQYVLNMFEYAMQNYKPIVVGKYCCNSYASLPHMLKYNTSSIMYFVTYKVTCKKEFETILSFFHLEFDLVDPSFLIADF